MPPEKIKTLHHSFHNLYRLKAIPDCDDGWYPLIHESSGKLEEQIKKTGWDQDFLCYAMQVKEKYGSLCFYMSMLTEEMEEEIEKAEVKSAKICEKCGKEGKIKTTAGIHGWLFCRCEECSL